MFDFLVPFFFVVTAARMDPGQLGRGSVGLTVALVLVTLVAKFGACSLAAGGPTLRHRLQVGAGMLPRNEVTLVVAAASLGAGQIDRGLFSVLVACVLVSTVTAAPILRLAIPRQDRGTAPPAGEGPPEAPGRDEPELPPT